MRKKGIPDVFVRSVMSLYEDSDSVDSELSEELEINVEIHQGPVLSPFLFALVIDAVTEFARDGALSELLCADDLVLMSETIKVLWDKILRWKEAFERKGLKLTFEKTKVIVSSGITQDCLSKSKVDPRGVQLRSKS